MAVGVAAAEAGVASAGERPDCDGDGSTITGCVVASVLDGVETDSDCLTAAAGEDGIEDGNDDSLSGERRRTMSLLFAGGAIAEGASTRRRRY